MMKIVQPEGNYFDKYNDTNIIVKKLMQGFFSSIDKMLLEIEFKTILEAGCGEGYVSQFLYKKGNTIDAFDISEKVVQEAQKAFPGIRFSVGSIYNIAAENGQYDLVIASEVLEHLEEPKTALCELFRVSKRYVFISVPNEPIWRVLNLARGKYIKDLGNTPGHIQHWSKSSIRKLCEENGGKILKESSPLPWTMILMEKPQ